MSAQPPDAPSRRIHGHEVMSMMLEADRGMTRSELVSAILERFGPRACFHTCSAEDLTAEQIVDFLSVRGKVTETDGRLSTAPERICSHDEGHVHDEQAG